MELLAVDDRLVVPLALIVLAGCRKDSPEAQIQKSFDACVKALEEGDFGSAVDVLSPQFEGPEGMRRDEAKLYLMGLLRQEKVGITVFASRIEVKGSQGTQSVEVMLTSRSGSSILPEDASRRLFLLRWERLDGDWRLRSLQTSGNA
jgi:hypothetical protein